MPRPLDTDRSNQLSLLKGYKQEATTGVLDKKPTLEIFDDESKVDFHPAMRIRAWDGECSMRIDIPRVGESYKDVSHLITLKNTQDQFAVSLGAVKH